MNVSFQNVPRESVLMKYQITPTTQGRCALELQCRVKFVPVMEGKIDQDISNQIQRNSACTSRRLQRSGEILINPVQTYFLYGYLMPVNLLKPKTYIM